MNVVGYLDATSGLGERARELVATLRAGGIEVSEWSVPGQGREVTPVPTRQRVFETTIAVVTAVQLADVRSRLPEPFERATRTIGYFFWELALVPDEQQWGIGLVDEIFAPTRFVAEAYRSATDTPVQLVPLPLPLPSSPRTNTDPSTFDVLVSFDLLSVMERKNPIGAIEAFRRAFPHDERVRLTVKTLNGDRRPQQLDRLRAAVGGDPRIILRDEHLGDDALAELIASSNVMLSLHRSEGLGLHLADAMALGTLVVASRYGGNLDVMDDDCAALVDVELIEVRDGEGAYSPPACWADPDLDEAAAFLRRAFEDPDWSDRLARRARERVAGSPSREEIGANLAAIL